MDANRPVGVVQYWGGCPRMPNSRWRRTLHLVRACAAEGWRTWLVLSELPRERELIEPFVHAACQIIVEPRARGNFDPGCILRTYRLLADLDCDIFHCYNVHTSPLIGAALAGVPVRIWSVLSMSRHYEEGERLHGWHRLQPSLRLSAHLAHRIACISAPVLREFEELGVPPAKLVEIPPQIDLPRFENASPDGLRRELGFADDALLVTTVGHAVPVKGWDILLRAFAQLATARPQARLLLVGSTEAAHERATAAELRALATALGVESRVVFAGVRTDIPRILAASDMFVLPSRSEGLSSALLEAMAAARACVGSRTGGTPTIIRDGHNGLLFEREDVDGLAAALEKLADDPDLRVNLGRSARDAVQQFDLARIVDGTIGLYADLLARSARATCGQEILPVK